MRGLHTYNNVHKGKTVFILGNGTELNGIDPVVLKDEIVIGCNNAHLWKSDPNFLIAGHAIFPMLWEDHTNAKDACIFHGLPLLSIPKLINHTRYANAADTHHFEKNVTEESFLVGCDMVGFSATHLALIIGAKNIVYIGFDSRYPHHYYDFEPYHSKLWWQLQGIKPKYEENEELKEEIAEFELRHVPPGVNAMGRVLEDYYKHLQKFSVLFYILKDKYKVNVFATQPESITVNAGAIYKPLNELL